MAMLRKDQSEGASYLEIAEFVQQQGAKGAIQQDRTLSGGIRADRRVAVMQLAVSLQPNACIRDDLPPARMFGSNEGCKLLGRIAADFATRAEDGLANVR